MRNILRRAARMLHVVRAVFSLRESREIFVYFDGQQERRADPLRLYRALWNDPECDLAVDGKTASDPKMTRDGKPVRAIYKPEEVQAAEERVIALTRRAFSINPFEEGGLTILETDALLGRFLDYAEILKKKRSPSPMPTPLSEATESTFSEPPASLPTKSDSDCGCTAIESSADAPTP